MLSEGVLTAFSKAIDDGVPLVPLLPSKEITRLGSIKDTSTFQILQIHKYHFTNTVSTLKDRCED